LGFFGVYFGRSSTEKVRLHHQLIPNKVFVESGYPPALVDYLRKAGHNVESVDTDFVGNVQVILVREDGLLSAGADPRKGSGADGY
jgi:gamma-glutamyltranspeptidase